MEKGNPKETVETQTYIYIYSVYTERETERRSNQKKVAWIDGALRIALVLGCFPTFFLAPINNLATDKSTKP